MTAILPGQQLPRNARIALTILLGLAAAILYGLGLDHVPPHLHHDEIYFGLFGHSVAESGRDLNGRWFPLMFQVPDSIHWYPPVSIYVTALFLKVLPLSDAAVRLPNAVIGVANVLLMAAVVRRLMRHDALALLAGALLLATPAHLLHSRISTDSLYPVTVILLWLLLLLRYLEARRARLVFAAASCLGVGVYTYIASIVMMPIYFLLTMWCLLYARASRRDLGAAVAGFAWPMVFGAVFFLMHPGLIADMADKYSVGGAGDLNAFQRARDMLTPWNISDRLNLLHSAFSPGYLFVTGGSNIAHSTRLAGVFLAPMAVFLAAGFFDVLTRPSRTSLLILAGFFTAPLASIIVPEDFAVTRMLGLLPFGVLLAVLGVARLSSAPWTDVPRWPLIVAGGAIIAVGLGYAILARPSGAALALMVAGAALIVTTTASARTGTWAPVTALLLLLTTAHFAVFAFDYFGDYRARATGRYGYNLRGAIEQVIALRPAPDDAAVYLNTDIPYVQAYWEFYLKVNGRRDLLPAARAFDTRTDLLDVFAPGSLLLSDGSEATRALLGTRPDYREVGAATDPVAAGSADGPVRTSFLIYQKQ